MSSIVKSLDKRTGTIYVYESESYWDKELRAPRNRRHLIGKIDPETGKMIKTNGRGKRNPKPEKNATSDAGSAKELRAIQTQYAMIREDYLNQVKGESTTLQEINRELNHMALTINDSISRVTNTLSERIAALQKIEKRIERSQD